MSSTNRHNADKRHIADYYVTPVDDIVKFLSAFDEEVTLNIWDRQILDPCAGGDELHDMSYPKALKEYYAIKDYVMMLLRLNFLETKARKDFFDNYMPSWIFVHHKRMSFTDAGGTDSVAYCHMV